MEEALASGSDVDVHFWSCQFGEDGTASSSSVVIVGIEIVAAVTL